MNNIDDGGPAFPQPPIIAANGCQDFPWNGYGMGGLSMRDYFAGQALMGLCAEDGDWAENPWQYTAEFAYRMADAMLAARNPQTTNPTNP